MIKLSDTYTEEYFDELYLTVEENDPLKLLSVYDRFLENTTLSGVYYTCDYDDYMFNSEYVYNYDAVKDLNYTPCGNVFKYNNKIVIIDFEHTGISLFQFRIRDWYIKMNT